MSDEEESRLADFPKQISFQCNNKIIDQMEKCTCKIKYGNEQGTGFFTKIPISKQDEFVPVLVLCNHTHKEKLEEKDVISVIIQSEKDIKKIDINGRKYYTSKKYDVTIIELKDKDNISQSHYIELDDRVIEDIKEENEDDNNNGKYVDETIYITQYPDGELSVSFGIVKARCEDKKYDFKHLCCTSHGSSGSPILLLNNKVIGIHKKGNRAYNLGTFLNYPIIEFIRENYGSNRDKIKDEIKNKKINVEELINIDSKEVNLNGQNLGNICLEIIRKKDPKNMNQLILSSNSIDNLEPLINMKLDKLQILNLQKNKISDIKQLGKINCPKLTLLNLMNNNISDISILEKMNLLELKELLLNNNKIEDIKVLEKVKCPKLEILDFKLNQISDINILSKVKFKELKELYLSNNKISNITVFKNVNFPNLEQLSLAANKLEKIDDLSAVNFPKIKKIYLNDNNISDITLLASIKLGNSAKLVLSEKGIDKKKNAFAIQSLGDKISFA